MTSPNILPKFEYQNLPFWEALSRHVVIQEMCDTCGRKRMPLLPTCPYCGSACSHEIEVSGTGTIYSWIRVMRPLSSSAPDVPYSIVTVDLDGGARTFGQLVPPDRAKIWTGGSALVRRSRGMVGTSIHICRSRGRRMTSAAIAGIGYTELSRDSGRSVLSLATEACRNALDDAGVSSADVDGIASFMLMSDSVPCQAVATTLAVPELRFVVDANLGGQAPCYLVWLAAMAVETGRANNVLVFAP